MLQQNVVKDLIFKLLYISIKSVLYRNQLCSGKSIRSLIIIVTYGYQNVLVAKIKVRLNFTKKNSISAAHNRFNCRELSANKHLR